MSDWEEIKRLAADFQRTQTSDTLQRLSDRNVIDIVKKLTDLKLINLIYTCDGKEFVTPEQLRKEIEDEVYVNEGRVHLHDLATKLNVDYQHVEATAEELAKEKPEYSVILGQVIHSSYKITLGKIIEPCMLATGLLCLADLAKNLDLPSEFLSTLVEEILPKILDDYVVGQDGRTYYTTDMMDKYKSVIVGTLSAILKPVSVASIMKRLDIPERIFLPIVDGLIKDGRLDASVENRLYIPAIYAREQNDWINKFYRSNNYIEYEVLTRMDIKQPKSFLRKSFPDGIQLKTCFVSPSLLSQVESMIEDCIASNGWLDISTVVPTAIEAEDIKSMLAEIFKKNKQSCLVFNQVNVCSPGYIESCRNSFQRLMGMKAQEHLKQGRLVNYFMGGKIKESSKKPEESRKEVESQEKPAANEEGQIAEPAVSGKQKEKKSKVDPLELSDEETKDKKSKGRKSGGGLVGREVKQKAVKKKYIPGNKGGNVSDEDTAPATKGPRSNKGRAARRGVSPEGHQSVKKGSQPAAASAPEKEPLIFMTTQELIEKLSRDSRDGSDDFYESIAQTIECDLNKEYEVTAKKTLDDFLKSQAEKAAEDDDAENADVDLVE